MAKSDAYRRAGVDIKQSSAFVEEIRHHLRRTYCPRVIPNPGGFGGLFRLDFDARLFERNYRKPVLVASTDGVGTKLKIAFAMDRHRSVGIDLVAMSVNDLIVRGAEPLFFQDYVATGKLKRETLLEVVAGIADGCVEAECSLLGGETAELPGFYGEGEYDLAGFCVGVVEKDRIVDGSRVEKGDLVIGLSSSGLHSNGFSLARKVLLEEAGLALDSFMDELGGTLGVQLLTPTRIYSRPVLSVLRYYRVKHVVHAMAHITGGGLYGSIPRVIPEDSDVRLHRDKWSVHRIFSLIQTLGHIDDEEMHSVFNMGLGMVLIVPPYYAQSVVEQLTRAGENAQIVGEVVRGRRQVIIE